MPDSAARRAERESPGAERSAAPGKQTPHHPNALKGRHQGATRGAHAGGVITPFQGWGGLGASDYRGRWPRLFSRAPLGRNITRQNCHAPGHTSFKTVRPQRIGLVFPPRCRPGHFISRTITRTRTRAGEAAQRDVRQRDDGPGCARPPSPTRNGVAIQPVGALHSGRSTGRLGGVGAAARSTPAITEASIVSLQSRRQRLSGRTHPTRTAHAPKHWSAWVSTRWTYGSDILLAACIS